MQYENKKKGLKKQLFAAIIMLLVAALALGTATYAWFVNNNTVEGKGLKVNATADTSLQIKGTDKDEVFGSVGTSTTEQTSLKPVTSADGKYFASLKSTVKVKSGASAAAEGSGTSKALAGADLTTAPTTSYATAQYTLKALSDKTDGVPVYVDSITMDTGSDSTLKAASRVAITISDTTYAYNIGGGSVIKDQMCGISTDGKSWDVAAPTYKDVGSGSTWTFTPGTEYNAKVVVWYEGQDTECKSDNIDTKDITLTIKFARVVAD